MATSIPKGLTMLIQLQLLLLVLFTRSTSAGVIDIFKRAGPLNSTVSSNSSSPSNSTIPGSRGINGKKLSNVFTKINSITPADPKLDVTPDGHYLVNATWELDISGKDIRENDYFTLTASKVVAIALKKNEKFTDEFQLKLNDGTEIAKCVIDYEFDDSEAIITCTITKLNIHYYYTYLKGWIEFPVSFNDGISPQDFIYARFWASKINGIEFQNSGGNIIKYWLDFENTVDYTDKPVLSCRYNSKGTIIYYMSTPRSASLCTGDVQNVTYSANWRKGNADTKYFGLGWSRNFNFFGYAEEHVKFPFESPWGLPDPLFKYDRFTRNGGVVADGWGQIHHDDKMRFVVHGIVNNVDVSYGTKFKLSQMYIVGCKSSAPNVYQPEIEVELRAFEAKAGGFGTFIDDEPTTSKSSTAGPQPTGVKELKDIFTKVDSIKVVKDRVGGPFDYYMANFTWTIEVKKNSVRGGDYFYLDMPDVFSIPVPGDFSLGDVINGSPIAVCSVIQEGAGKKSSSKIKCTADKSITSHELFVGYVSIPIMFDGGGRVDSTSIAKKWQTGNNEVVFNGNLKGLVHFPTIKPPSKMQSVQVFTGDNEIYIHFITDARICPAMYNFTSGQLRVTVDGGKWQRTSSHISMVSDVSPFGFPTELTELTPTSIGGFESTLELTVGPQSPAGKRFSYSGYFTHERLVDSDIRFLASFSCEGSVLGGDYSQGFVVKDSRFKTITKTTQVRQVN